MERSFILNFIFQFMVAGTFFLASMGTANADVACTLVLKQGAPNPIFQEGDICDEEFAPASTFKIVLALIGFETGLLLSPDEPRVEYDPALNAPYKSWRLSTTPQSWLRYSVVWYSHWITKRLGMEQFQKHVDALDYGNRDLRGTPGKNDGLTRAWLSTSLKITPRQQAKFLMRLVSGDLAISDLAVANTMAATQKFEAQNSLRIFGKTGNAWAIDAAANRMDEQHGWFVGWLQHDGARVVYVHLIVEDGDGAGFASSRARKNVLKNIVGWLSEEDS